MLNKSKAKEENDSHQKKCRKYNASYIKFGFTSQYRNGREYPQCVGGSVGLMERWDPWNTGFI